MKMSYKSIGSTWETEQNEVFKRALKTLSIHVIKLFCMTPCEIVDRARLLDGSKVGTSAVIMTSIVVCLRLAA